jgi:hypothetical protein
VARAGQAHRRPRCSDELRPALFSIDSHADVVRISIDVPSRSPAETLRLRLRLPRESHVSKILLDGRPFNRLDPASETIDLSGLAGDVVLMVAVARR